MARRGHNQTVGRWGEEVAAQFLLRQGFSVIERNYHTTRGEVDIVAQKGNDFYFVEVKTREEGALASDLAVTYTKKERLRHAVKHFCYHRRIIDMGIVLASLLVTIRRSAGKVQCRLAVIY